MKQGHMHNGGLMGQGSAHGCPLCRYMHELGKHVPVIPVVMKADTMTIGEAAKFRQEVAARLENPRVPGEDWGDRA
jgi:hypothetical protein